MKLDAFDGGFVAVLESGAVVEFSDIEPMGSGVRAIVRFTATKGPHFPSQRIDLTSLAEKNGYRKTLSDLGLSDTTDGLELHRAASAVVESVCQADRSTDLRGVADKDDDALWLIEGLLLSDGPNLLYGMGEVGKTWIAAKIASCVMRGAPFLGRQTQQANVGWIDNENTAERFKARMKKVLRGEDGGTVDEYAAISALNYWPNDRPLSAQVVGLEQWIRKNKIGFVVIDSAAGACGGDPREEGPAINYFDTLKRLGVPSLTIAHVTKGDSSRSAGNAQRAFNTRYPLGSIFWHNRSRITWLVLGDSERGADVKPLTLRCNKSNEAKRPADVGITLQFSRGALSLSNGARGGVGAAERPPASERILLVLREAGGPLTIEQIAVSVGIAEGTVKARLNELQREGRARKSGSLERRALWVVP